MTNGAVDKSATELKAEANAPDPDHRAVFLGLGFIGVAVMLGLVATASGWDQTPFRPAEHGTANFALFAGFYVAAQVIERLLEPIAPIFPTWKRTSLAAARADRAQIMIGVSVLVGVAASFAFGLCFLEAIGMHTTRTIDVLVSGSTIGAGTKPLHDLISAISKSASSS
jgi:hypothetical protein